MGDVQTNVVPRQNATSAVVEESHPDCPVNRQNWDDRIHSRLGAAEEGMANAAEECIGLALSSHPTVYGAALGSASTDAGSEADDAAEDGIGPVLSPHPTARAAILDESCGIGPALPPCPTARAATLDGGSASTGGPLARSPSTPPSCFCRRLVMGGVLMPSSLRQRRAVLYRTRSLDKRERERCMP